VLLNEPSGQGYCVEKSPPDKELYFLPGKVAMYDPVAKSWSYTSVDSMGGWEGAGSAEYDPVSGLIFVVDRYSVWTYDPVKQSRSSRLSYVNGAMGYGKNLIYFPPTRRMYYIADGAAIFELDPGGGSSFRLSLKQVRGITGDAPTLQETGFAYDAVNHIIGGGVSRGVFHAYDPARKTWVRLVMKTIPEGAPVGTVAFHALAYDPVNNVFIFITDQESGRRTWAYRYASERGSVPVSPGSSPPTR